MFSKKGGKTRCFHLRGIKYATGSSRLCGAKGEGGIKNFIKTFVTISCPKKKGDIASSIRKEGRCTKADSAALPVSANAKKGRKSSRSLKTAERLMEKFKGRWRRGTPLDGFRKSKISYMKGKIGPNVF